MVINKIKSRFRAFSLIELSVLILVISIAAAGALSISKVNVKNSAAQITRDRMLAINDALIKFVTANRRLPCPASLTLTPNNANFGVEAPQASPATCVLAGVINSTSSTNLSYGMVPTDTLQLPKEMASDGFGTKFSYVVDERFTLRSVSPSASGATAGFELTRGTIQGATAPVTIITIKDGSVAGTTVDSLALYTLISHGPNKAGGYPYNGTVQNTLPTNPSDEYNNSAIAAFVGTFVENSTTTTFDDVISYKNKATLLNNAGLQYIMCANDESYWCSTPGAHTTLPCAGNLMVWASAYYLVSATSTNTCLTPGARRLTRVCDPYGVWRTPTGTDCTS